MNYTTKNIFLLFSIGLNVLFLSVAIFFVARKGGISYVQSKISNIGKKSTEKDWYINSYYKHKKSQFEILPKSNDSIIFLGDSLTDQGEWAELLGNPDRKSTRLNSSHVKRSRMPSSA